jgi:hypothetical protein
MSSKKHSIRKNHGKKISFLKKRTPSSLSFETLESRLAMAVVLNEFLAENNTGIRDFSGERHDWIELKNNGGATVNVSGWYLTDDALNLTKWQIPATPESQSLAPGEVLLVYASDKNGVFSNELHTNFKLSLEGEYLGLVQGTGTTVEHAFNPYPVQIADVSYGSGASAATTSNQTLVGASTAVRVISPTSENAARDDHWRGIGFDDSTWLSGTGGVGFDRTAAAPNLAPFIGRTLTVGEMDSTDATPQYSAYVRYAFNVTNKDELTSLQLALRFDDGFIAYLNGKRVARANFAEDFVYTQPGWDSYAGLQVGSSSTAGNVQRTAEADDIVLFDLTPYLSELVEGTNVLAFHGVNSRSTANSNEHRLDFLIQPELTATRATSSQTGYMVVPTPGASNAIATMGIVDDTKFSVDRGFFDAPFQTTITTETPGATIRYTTDGSLPTGTNGTVYSGPINVTTTTTLRAAAFLTGFTSANVDTQTYMFLSDVIQQDASYVTQPYATWGHDGPDSGSESGYNLDDESDWEMDPDIVNGNEAAVIIALKSIPTMSVVMDWDNLFGGTPMLGTPAGAGVVAPVPQGIYIHGRSEERQTSLEYLNPNVSTDQFQIDAVIEIQGHSSPTRWNSDKLSFQLSFKGPYGDPKLEYDLFAGSPDGSNAAKEFDGLILDAMFNYSWVHSNPVQRNYARFVTDQVVADLQNAASEGGPHGKYVHLYLNGLYWGLYNVHERPDDGYAAEYHGGEKEDYYVVKHANSDINHEYTWVEGGIAAEEDYQALLNAARAVENSPTSLPNYQAVQNVLDVDSFIDYMIVHFYGGNGADWAHNNWYAERNSNGGLWHFHAWDNEHAFPTTDNGDDWSQTSNLTGKDDFEAPTEIHQNLMENHEYRLRFADRVQELMYNGGVLTPAAAASAYQARLTEIDQAIIGESARWGDNRTPNDPYTRDDFLKINSDPSGDGRAVLTDFFPARTAAVLSHFDGAGWIPSLDAPLFSQYGGEITSGFDLTLTKPVGSPGEAVIYYTLDGSDPRDATTNLASDSAISYSGPIDLIAGAQAKARIFFNNSGTSNDWSPIVAKTYTLEDPLTLRIVEIMYNPPGSADDTEYFELLNTGTESIQLAGVQITEFSSGGYTFSAQTLNPGERIVVVKDQTAFAAAYPNVTNVASGVFSGSLANEGELISLLGPLGELLQSFTYGDSNIAGWPTSADGDGYSLEYIGPLDAGENPLDVSPADPFDNPANWRASLQLNGSPGTGGDANEPDSADFDGDGDIDGRDFLLWQRGYGKTITAVKEDGDADNNGDVDGGDLIVWQDQYGTTPPLSAIGAVAAEDSSTAPALPFFWIDLLDTELAVFVADGPSDVTNYVGEISRDDAFAQLAAIAAKDDDFGDIAVSRDRNVASDEIDAILFEDLV